jgi:aminomethyltransferase
VTEAAAELALARTPLDALHRARGARMVAFAGFSLPLQYASGIIAEHKHTRLKASLFDVSHMGQVLIAGEAAARALETLVPSDIEGLGPGQMRYTLLTDEGGGIRDDLMMTRIGPRSLLAVVNAACRKADLDYLRASLPGLRIDALDERALLAVQGPMAARVMAALAPAALKLAFLKMAEIEIGGIPCFVSRSGYTGEDGFEISLAAADAETLAERLLAEKDVAPAGLGARDSLRLEAGLCLYGRDIDRTTSPVEADLAWTIARHRRQKGGFPGFARIKRELEQGPERKRVGLSLKEKGIAREGSIILTRDGVPIGRVTSGGYGPSVGHGIAMGYVASIHARPGLELAIEVRGHKLAADIVALPFVPHRYAKP